MKNKRYTVKITLLFIHRVIHVESTGYLGIIKLCIFRLWKMSFYTNCTAKISRRRGYYYAAF